VGWVMGWEANQSEGSPHSIVLTCSYSLLL